MLVGNSSRLVALRTISKVNRSGITTFSLMLKDFQWFSLFFTDCILRWMNFNNCLCFFQEFVHVCNDLQWFHEFPRISIFRKGLQCSKDFHMFSIVFVCSLVSSGFIYNFHLSLNDCQCFQRCSMICIIYSSILHFCFNELQWFSFERFLNACHGFPLFSIAVSMIFNGFSMKYNDFRWF